MFRYLPLFFLFSVTATLLLPISSRHVHFNTFSVREGKNTGSERGSATVKIVDQDGNVNAQGHLKVDYVFMACDERQNCSSNSPTSSPGSDSANVVHVNSIMKVSPAPSRAVATANATVTAHSSTSASIPTSSPPSPTLIPASAPGFLLPTPSPAPAPAFLFPGHFCCYSGEGQSGVASAVVAVLCLCMIIYGVLNMFSSTSATNSDLRTEEFLRNHEALARKRYTLSEVKKMTKSFEVKLGQGGFGTVYKGKLPNGDLVAVKLLNTSKENGEDFINEVDSISRTSHINVVTLLGFCLEGSKKALIYEFMPHGSLDKFIYKAGKETNASLSFESLYQISIGIARGLEYLHRGCNTRILHFDIKPHNILLDENLCPKISDFGLAKLCPRNNSIVSMSDPRGTIGYVAPEMWNRRFGGVSHKSDVYSYGMILLDMVGERRNTSAEASHSSETYFPDWIYNRLEQSNLKPNDGVTTIEENEIMRRMILVGLWCIQTFPNDRPTMSRVIDMLEGSQNSLDIPPRPILSSPTRSIQESSTT